MGTSKNQALAPVPPTASPSDTHSSAHLTPEERAARGKNARRKAPRSSHASWKPPEERPDPVALLVEQSATRLPDLVPIRYGRMITSPLAFYRGSAAIMASDLARTPRTGLRAQLCGDAHLSNFGVFSAPDRSLVFDINDFDETLPGPWEWDVKRLVASYEVAMRERAIEPAERRDVVLTAARTYRETMARFAAEGNLDVFYARLDSASLLAGSQAGTDKKQARRLRANLDKAQSKNSLRALGRLTETVDGRTRILSQPPLLVPIGDFTKGEDTARVSELIHEVLAAYRASLPDDRRHLLSQYEYVEAAHKVVGVGSVGLRSWIVLMQGRDERDPLFLQLKQAQESVLEREGVGRSRYRNHGRRVVEGQRLIQAASDVLLGWCRVTALDGVSRDFHVRQLWDGKGSADVSAMRPALFGPHAEACAWTLARGHARTGDRIAIAAYLGTGDAFDVAVADFAIAYADQNEMDYRLLCDAEKAGRITVERGM